MNNFATLVAGAASGCCQAIVGGGGSIVMLIGLTSSWGAKLPQVIALGTVLPTQVRRVCSHMLRRL